MDGLAVIVVLQTRMEDSLCCRIRGETATCSPSLCTPNCAQREISFTFQISSFQSLSRLVSFCLLLLFGQLSGATFSTAPPVPNLKGRSELQNLPDVCSESEHRQSFAARLTSISCCFCLQSCQPRHDRRGRFGERTRLWHTAGQMVLDCTGT